MLSGPEDRYLSLNPPHLLDAQGKATPGALIPICAYNENMNLLGQKMEGTTFPVCDQFKPIIKDGRVCHALNMADLASKKKGPSKPGRRFGVWLVINADMATEEDFFIPSEFRVYKKNGESVTIHLSLLQEYTDVRAGVYGLTGLKKLTGTESFLNLPDDDKKCQVGNQETCRNDDFIEKVKTECGCVPWSLQGNYVFKEVCTPPALSCVENIRKRKDKDNCRQSCTGLHAVVGHQNNRAA